MALLGAALTGCSDDGAAGDDDDDGGGGGGADTAPLEVGVAAGASFALGAHGDWVYWLATEGVMRMPVTGGAATLVRAETEGILGQPVSRTINVDADYLYFPAEMQGIGRCPVTGGADSYYPALADYSIIIPQMTACSDYLYFHDNNNRFVGWLSKSGGSYESLGSLWASSVGAMGCADATLCWRTGSDGQRIYCAVDHQSLLGPEEPYVAEVGGAMRIAVDATHVYWTTTDDDRLMAAPLPAGANTSGVELARTGQVDGAIVADAGVVYFTSCAGGTVSSVAVAGGSPTVIAEGQACPAALALFGEYLYWANRDDDRIMRIRR